MLRLQMNTSIVNNFELGIPNLKFTNLDEKIGWFWAPPFFLKPSFGWKAREFCGVRCAQCASCNRPRQFFCPAQVRQWLLKRSFLVQKWETPRPKRIQKAPFEGMNTFLANSRKSQEIPWNPEHLHQFLHHFTSSIRRKSADPATWLGSPIIFWLEPNWRRIPNCHQVP